ncbi:MAG: alpha/beta hydrolase [Cytophagales bacterium]|nr:MAG: alpha/beta hydrolase [Cytophagales bacterium]
MVKLAYNANGTGFPIVFLHGFCEDKSIWFPFVEPLLPHHQIICIDLPNFGQSPAMPDATVEKMADSVVVTLDSLGVEKCILVGHSLGGYVGLAIAEFYPERLFGMVMFHSTAFEDSPERKQNRHKAMNNIRQNGVDVFVRALIPSLFAPAQKQDNHIRTVINNLIESAKNLPPENVIAAVESMLNRKERTEVLKRVSFPFLFLVGKEDAAVPLEASLAQCFLPQNSVVYILADVGHMGMIEAPQEFAKAIFNFINYCR